MLLSGSPAQLRQAAVLSSIVCWQQKLITVHVDSPGHISIQNISLALISAAAAVALIVAVAAVSEGAGLVAGIAQWRAVNTHKVNKQTGAGIWDCELWNYWPGGQK